MTEIVIRFDAWRTGLLSVGFLNLVGTGRLVAEGEWFAFVTLLIAAACFAFLADDKSPSPRSGEPNE